MAYISKDISENIVNDLSENTIDLSQNIFELGLNQYDCSNESAGDKKCQSQIDISKNEITCLCFSGGGIKGFSFVGALTKLMEKNIINIEKIDTFVGTSAGSMFSFFLVLGFTIDEIKDFIMTFNFSKLNGEIDCINLLESFGINNGERIKLLFSKFLEIKYSVKDITFKELYNLTNKKLLVIGTNLTKSREELFSVDSTPDMSVITAIRISTSVPIIFTPVNYNGDLYVDGALVNNFPINYCPIDNTYGIYVKNCNENYEVNSIQSFMIKCLNITSDTISEKNLNSNYKNVIKIINPRPEFTKFDLTPEYKKDLIDLGFNTTETFLSNLQIN